jgi:hypothetical protein
MPEPPLVRRRDGERPHLLLAPAPLPDPIRTMDRARWSIATAPPDPEDAPNATPPTARDPRHTLTDAVEQLYDDPAFVSAGPEHQGAAVLRVVRDWLATGSGRRLLKIELIRQLDEAIETLRDVGDAPPFDCAAPLPDDPDASDQRSRGRAPV